MVKTLKEYLSSTITVGGLGLIKPMSSLSRKGTDIGPKGSRGRRVGLSASNEPKDGKAYAIGMAKAKEVMKDEPPLEKKTITKAHDIAKAIQRNERKQKPYVSSVNGVYSVLDGDGKEVFKTRDKTLAHGWFKKNYDKIKETKKK